MSPKPPTVLLVDDDALFLKALARSLNSWGFRVLTARDAVSALDMTSEHHPDVLVTDVVMPEKDGVWLAKQVEALHPQLRVLIVSGHKPETLQRFGPLPNSVRFLAKPFGPARLLAEVQDLIA